jgi:hypothetical protein
VGRAHGRPLSASRALFRTASNVPDVTVAPPAKVPREISFDQAQRELIAHVVLLNWSVRRWCERQRALVDVPVNPKAEMQGVVVWAGGLIASQGGRPPPNLIPY